MTYRVQTRHDPDLPRRTDIKSRKVKIPKGPIQLKGFLNPVPLLKRSEWLKNKSIL